MKERSISIFNVFMCFCVVVAHLIGSSIGNYAGSPSYRIFYAISIILKFAVPCFIFLSGYKLCKKYENTEFKIKEFYLRRLKKIVIPYVICYLIYFVYFYYFKQWASIDDLFPGILKGVLGAQFYYVIVAIQLYLLFPLIKKLFDKHFTATLIGSFLITFLFTAFIHFSLDVYIFTFWIFYFVLGMTFAKREKDFSSLPLTISAIIIFIITGALMAQAAIKSAEQNITISYYPTLLILYSTLAPLIFIKMFRRIDNVKNKMVNITIDFFDFSSYYIFLYHVLMISIITNDILINTSELYNNLTQTSVFAGLTQRNFNLIFTTILTFIFIVILCGIRKIINKAKARLHK